MNSFYETVINFLDQQAYLVPATRGQPDTCSMCEGKYKREDFSTCFSCDHKLPKHMWPKELGLGIYAKYNEQSGHLMTSYKNAGLERNIGIVTAIAYLGLSEALERHSISRITFVPSFKKRESEHPLFRVLQNAAAKIEGAPEVEKLLEVSNFDEIQKNPREINTNHLECIRPLEGENILLVDDTWTSGGHFISATQALRLGGANEIIGIALARWIADSQSDQQWYKDRMQRGAKMSSHRFFK